ASASSLAETVCCPVCAVGVSLRKVISGDGEATLQVLAFRTPIRRMWSTPAVGATCRSQAATRLRDLQLAAPTRMSLVPLLTVKVSAEAANGASTSATERAGAEARRMSHRNSKEEASRAGWRCAERQRRR